MKKDVQQTKIITICDCCNKSNENQISIGFSGDKPFQFKNDKYIDKFIQYKDYDICIDCIIDIFKNKNQFISIDDTFLMSFKNIENKNSFFDLDFFKKK